MLTGHSIKEDLFSLLPGKIKLKGRVERLEISTTYYKNHYAIVGRVLLETLQVRLGPKYDQKTATAWERIAGAVFGLMQEGAPASTSAYSNNH